MSDEKRSTIELTPHEIQSGLDRQRHAELLILQLPDTHEGRNDWLVSYGVGSEAVSFRERHSLDCPWSDEHRAVVLRRHPGSGIHCVPVGCKPYDPTSNPLDSATAPPLD